MASFPHEYKVSSSGGPEGSVKVEGEGLPTLDTEAPPAFGGPEGHWSPETMLTGAVANCLILTFRALARSGKLDWKSLDVECAGEVDKTAAGLKFTGFKLKAVLTVGADTDEEKAKQSLENAKKYCLVTASLNAGTELDAEVRKG